MTLVGGDVAHRAEESGSGACVSLGATWTGQPEAGWSWDRSSLLLAGEAALDRHFARARRKGWTPPWTAHSSTAGQTASQAISADSESGLVGASVSPPFTTEEGRHTRRLGSLCCRTNCASVSALVQGDGAVIEDPKSDV